MVYCGGDFLGELLGCQSFFVKDLSFFYDMLRKNFVILVIVIIDVVQIFVFVQDYSMDILS